MPKAFASPNEVNLSDQVARSVCSVKKKDMADVIPSLDSSNGAGLNAWAIELLSQVGPKGSGEEEYEDFFRRIQLVIPLLGTHGFKLPNPDVSTQPIFANRAFAKSTFSGILHERLLPQSLVYSGDASLMRIAKFLLARVNLDGNESTVLDELIFGDRSPVATALMANGMPKSACAFASALQSQRDSQDLSAIPVHPLTKQMYFEEEGFDDVILVPVAPTTVIAEMHLQAQVPGRWLASRSLCAIGGANPVNGGNLCSDLGGAFQLLEGKPPGRADQKLSARIARGGRVYTKFSVSTTDVMTFVRSASLEQKTGNANARDKEIANYQWFSEVMLAALIEADALTEIGVSADGESGGIGRFLRRNHEEEISDDMASDAAHEVLDIVTREHKELRQHLADLRISGVLVEIMKQDLK